MKPLDWMSHPIVADWSRRVILGRRLPAQRFAMDRPEKARQAQRDRARALLQAMGIKTKPSDNQVARMIEVLGPFVPGLTIQSPLSAVATPPEMGVAWCPPVTGRPPAWPPESLHQLLLDVAAVQASGRAATDKDALIAVAKGRRAKGERPPSPKTLANKLAEARAMFA